MPLITYGPSVGASIFLMFFACFLLGYLMVLIHLFADKKPAMAYVCYGTIAINLMLFFATMCGEQGVP